MGSFAHLYDSQLVGYSLTFQTPAVIKLDLRLNQVMDTINYAFFVTKQGSAKRQIDDKGVIYLYIFLARFRLRSSTESRLNVRLACMDATGCGHGKHRINKLL